MENKKQSSIEFIGQELFQHKIAFEYENVIFDILKQAEEVQKQEIIDAWINGASMLGAKNAEQYYNLTFNPQNNDKV